MKKETKSRQRETGEKRNENSRETGHGDGGGRFAEKGREPSVAVMVIGNELYAEVILRIIEVDFDFRGIGR